MIDATVVLTAFALILPAELPDKTFIATLVLATRYPRLWVWIGVGTAFFLQVLIAVTAGGLLALLPSRLVLGATLALFAVGAVVSIRSGLSSRAAERAAEDAEESEIIERVADQESDSRLRVVLISFGVLFAAEWGDLSQLLTAGLAARTDDPLSVFLGAWSALLVVSGVAVLSGAWLRSRVPLWRVRLLSGGILTALAVWTAIEFVRA